MARRVYWDSCVFIGLIMQEAERHPACLSVWREAEAGDTLILTSFFTWGEVFKAKCDGPAKPLTVEGDIEVEQILAQPHIEAVVVDEMIGIAARRLMRAYPECKKPSDGIHLATALRLNVDEMHTYDGSDLLKLDGKLTCANGSRLRICVPYGTPTLFDAIGGSPPHDGKRH